MATAAMTFTLSSAATDVAVFNAPVSQARLLGWSLHESAGVPAAAEILLRDGDDATGPVIAAINLAADGSDTQWFGPDGIILTNGLFVDRTAGTSEGCVYIG